MSDDDKEIYLMALRVVSVALDELVGECIGEDGRPKPPDRKTLMRARAALPPYCTNAFKKETA